MVRKSWNPEIQNFAWINAVPPPTYRRLGHLPQPQRPPPHAGQRKHVHGEPPAPPPSHRGLQDQVPAAQRAPEDGVHAGRAARLQAHDRPRVLLGAARRRVFAQPLPRGRVRREEGRRGAGVVGRARPPGWRRNWTASVILAARDPLRYVWQSIQHIINSFPPAQSFVKWNIAPPRPPAPAIVNLIGVVVLCAANGWVGWKKKSSPLELIFKFSGPRQLGRVLLTLYSYPDMGIKVSGRPQLDSYSCQGCQELVAEKGQTLL